MREPTGPQSNGTGPDDHRPPRHPADDLARLEDALQQLRQMLEAHDTAPRWVPLQGTREAVALAHRLLHGWQVQQAMTQVCLTPWQQTLETLETVGVALQRQAETPQAQMVQLRRAPWWAFLTGVGFMGMLALSAWLLASPPRPVPPWQALPPVPMVPGAVRPSEERPSPAPDATLTSETHDTPLRDGP